MPELSLTALRGLLPQMGGANFGVAGPQELADMPLTGLDKAVKYALPFSGYGEQAPRDETVAYRTPYGNLTTGDIDRATDMVMGFSSGGLSTKGIKAYHSSPHDFDKFDLSKIGTGEGAQMYGHGLYFAENPAVSGQGGQYWQQFRDRFPADERYAAEKLQRAGFDREAAIADARRDIEFMQQRYDRLPTGLRDNPKMHGAPTKTLLEDRQRELDLLISGQPVGPRTYEVNINADPAHFLDWDKAISTQPHVEETLRRGGFVDAKWPYSGMQGAQSGTSLQPLTSGEDAYRALGIEKRGRNAPLYDQRKAATDVFGEAGIPGIRYLDEGSRNAQPVLKTDRAGNVISSEYAPPTSNYVVFNPGIIDIMKKYGLAGLAPLAGYGAVAGQDQPQQ